MYGAFTLAMKGYLFSFLFYMFDLSLHIFSKPGQMALIYIFLVALSPGIYITLIKMGLGIR